MPLVRIDLRRGKSPEYRKAICDGVYRAMRETFNVPEEDRFMVVNEHDDDNFSFSRSYLNIMRTEDLVIIQITANNTRTVAQKKAFYARVVELLSGNPGIRPEDVLISLVQVTPEDWSFGHGMAQYVK